MTVDPGGCGLTAEDIAEDRAVERDQARRVAAREIARGNNWAAQKILEACDLPTGGLHAYRPQIGSADHALTVGAAEHRIADAVKVLRAAELNGLTVDSDEWFRLMGAVRDAADTAMGTGLMGGAA